MQQTAICVKEIAFIGYPTKNIQRSRQFYESLFNLTPSMVGEDGSFVEYDINGVTLSIGNYEGWDASTKGPCVAFEVDDLQMTLRILRENQAPVFMEPIETPVCRMASVGDPDGNSILIHERK